MKGQRRKRLINIVGFGAALGLLMLSGSSCFAQYEVTLIEPLSGYERSRAMGINHRGEVVGRFYSVTNDEPYDRQAFIWDKYNGARALPTLSGESGAWDINDPGLVSGYSYNASGHQRAVRWDSQRGSVLDLGTLLNTTTTVRGDESTAYNLNNRGQVVGHSDIPNDSGTFTPFHAFVYDDNSGIQDLGTFTNAVPQYQNGYSIAYSVNESGRIVGIANDAGWTFLPFVYHENGGMQPLTRHASHMSGEWYAVAINNAGLIGGHVISGTNRSIPYYWQNRSAPPVALSMPTGFPYGEIYSVNAAGQMVGVMWDTDQDDATIHGFVFDTINGVRDLNDLIDSGCPCTLHFARDINNRGQIVGYGERSGNMRGFLLDPQDLAPGDFDGDGVLDDVDNCTLEPNPSQCDTDGDDYGNHCDPDFNNNGVVDPSDFSLLKSVFGSAAAPEADLDCNGIVGSSDFSQLKASLGNPPGPSGLILTP